MPYTSGESCFRLAPMTCWEEGEPITDVDNMRIDHDNNSNVGPITYRRLERIAGRLLNHHE